jgi:nucleotide-binding universal stress UspA family protein
MRRFQNILYVTRGTEDETDSLKQALSLARNNATQLHVLIVSPVLPKSLGEYEAAYKASLADHVRASITNTQAALKMIPEEVPVRLEVECADTLAVHIVRRVLRNAHDLLIKQAEATQPRMGFRALDMQLLRQCPCPVWLCRPVTRPRSEIRVAVAVDPQSTEPAGWDLALQLLRLSRSLADTCSGELSIVSYWDYELENYLRHSAWGRVPEETIDSGVITAEREHRAALQALIDESGIAGQVRVHHVRGRAGEAIPQFVEDSSIDILVMGTVARTGIPGFVIGNTAENALRELQGSLLALKPNGFVSQVRAY